MCKNLTFFPGKVRKSTPFRIKEKDNLWPQQKEQRKYKEFNDVKVIRMKKKMEREKLLESRNRSNEMSIYESQVSYDKILR